MNWKDYKKEKPEKKHIDLRTQFLIKGHFQIGDKKGNTHYDVTRLCTYFDEDTVRFEEPANFVLLEWCYIL